MKPLELHIYDKHPDADAYYAGGSWTPYCLVSRDKRFSEAELCAEYYRSGFLHEYSLSENDGYDGMPETRAHRLQSAAFYRFATLPHYDEADQ